MAERPRCFLFLDECGGHETNKVDSKFPVFCLSGLVVEQDAYVEQLSARWDGFKAEFLKSRAHRIHEPEIRGRRLKHRLARYGTDAGRFSLALDELLQTGDYTLISAVIRKDEYHAEFANSHVDAFLPLSQYNIALDFILERFVHYLYYRANDARGLVIAERIGTKEAAQLRGEYTRLQLEGTQYVSPSWFRYQLDEAVVFGDKDDLIPGLEMTDVAARPIAEKVLNPEGTPKRWEPIKTKFYDGGQGRPESYGLKVFPSPIENSLFQ